MSDEAGKVTFASPSTTDDPTRVAPSAPAEDWLATLLDERPMVEHFEAWRAALEAGERG